MLISPSRGLFVWSPILILAFVGASIKAKHGVLTLLDGLAVANVVALWVLISTWPAWWAGYSLGPRFFVDVLPWLAYLMIPAVAAISETGERWVRAALLTGVAVLLAFSVFVQVRCATDFGPGQWNPWPLDVNRYQDRLWDWDDMQCLRKAGEVPDVDVGFRVDRRAVFGFGDDVPGVGWSFPERNPFGDTFAWMADETAAFHIDVQQRRPVFMEARILSWLTNESLDGLQVSVNGTPVEFRLTYDKEGAAWVRTVLPRDLWQRRLRYQRLEFTIDQLASPSAVISGSTDERMLGVAFDRIVVAWAD